MELMFKGLSNDALADRLCTVINHAMLPTCSAAHQEIVDSGCGQADTRRSLKYQWSKEKTCKDGITLLDPLVMSCPYVPSSSTLAWVLNGIAIFIIVLGSLFIAIMVYFRNEKAIRKSSFLLSCIVVLGAVLCAASVLLFSGEPSKKLCGGEYYFLGYGAALTIGALCMKVPSLLYRCGDWLRYLGQKLD
jgi:hypothetical protein